jgi:hypothetical protein
MGYRQDSHPRRTGDRIRDHFDETWREDHSEEDWEKVCGEILAAWDEWRYAWGHYPDE